jgi:hypothetical protein
MMMIIITIIIIMVIMTTIPAAAAGAFSVQALVLAWGLNILLHLVLQGLCCCLDGSTAAIGAAGYATAAHIYCCDSRAAGLRHSIRECAALLS